MGADDDPATMLVGVVERLLEQIERAPWIPSTWMREVLNENGLLRSRLLRRLPFDKISQFGQAIASAQAHGDANPNLEPLLAVLSALGLSWFTWRPENCGRRRFSVRRSTAKLYNVISPGSCCTDSFLPRN